MLCWFLYALIIAQNVWTSAVLTNRSCFCSYIFLLYYSKNKSRAEYFFYKKIFLLFLDFIFMNNIFYN